MTGFEQPAADSSVSYASPSTPRRRPKAYYEAIGYQRTMIPVLLTGGLCLLALGVSRWVVSPLSALGQLPLWMPIFFIAFALALIGAGVLVMLSVKKKLEGLEQESQDKVFFAQPGGQ
jgi:pilus assembly protein TadC